WLTPRFSPVNGFMSAMRAKADPCGSGSRLPIAPYEDDAVASRKNGRVRPSARRACTIPEDAPDRAAGWPRCVARQPTRRTPAQGVLMTGRQVSYAAANDDVLFTQGGRCRAADPHLPRERRHNR